MKTQSSIKFVKFDFAGTVAYNIMHNGTEIGRTWRVGKAWASQAGDGGAFLDRTATRAAAAETLVKRYLDRTASKPAATAQRTRDASKPWHGLDAAAIAQLDSYRPNGAQDPHCASCGICTVYTQSTAYNRGGEHYCGRPECDGASDKLACRHMVTVLVNGKPVCDKCSAILASMPTHATVCGNDCRREYEDCPAETTAPVTSADHAIVDCECCGRALLTHEVRACDSCKRALAAEIATINATPPRDIESTSDTLTEIPPCAAYMGCLCAGHARGNAASEPCNTDEGCPHDRDRECSACKRLRTGPFRGGTVLALLILILAPYLGACATQATRTADAYRALNDTQLRSAAAATAAMHASDDDDDRDCNTVATPDVDEGSGGVDQDACVDDCTDLERAMFSAQITRTNPPTVTPPHRSAPVNNAELITAYCPVTWIVVGTADYWTYTCTVNGTRIVIPVVAADAGLSGETVGNPSAAWVR